MDNGSSYSGLILPNLPPEGQFLCLFKGHFTTADPEARIPKHWKLRKSQDVGPAISFLGGGKKDQRNM